MNRFAQLMQLGTLLCLFIHPMLAWSTTPAGTLIRNQASASYLDAEGIRVRVTSNVVETRIEQIASLELLADQNNLAIAGGTTRFTHRVINTGNGDDTFSLQLINAGGDTIDLSGLSIYADSDRNGIADSETPISSTGWMAAGADFYVIVEATVPTSANNSDVALLTLTATSTFNTGLSGVNTNTTLIDDGATLRLRKSINRTQGSSPSTPYTIRLHYENTGAQTASTVTIIDALPSGMSYIPGSGQWSESVGSLSDADPLDTHTSAVSTARYCAYHTSCLGLAEAQLDTDNDSDNQVTFIIDSLVAGDAGMFSFQVSIDAGLDYSELINRAEYEMLSGGSNTARAFSNPVGFTVLPQADVVANGSQTVAIDGANEPVTIVSGAQGGRVLFENIIWNTGNRTDTFNIELDEDSSTMPTGSLYQLLRSDNATPLQDTNNDGITDTGPIAAGAFATVVLSVMLPVDVSGNNSGVGFSIAKQARSVSDSTVVNSVIDHLDQITSNQVDLTNQSAAGSPNALGSGPGPEALPVSILSANAGGQALVDLYIRHQGVNSDRYVLTAFSSAEGAELPDGWTLRFLDPATDEVLTDTGPLDSGAARHIVAEISVPDTAIAGQVSLFFEARSPLTGALDIKHDAIMIGINDELTLEPGLSAQIDAGGTVLYRHTLSNIGNDVITDIDIQLVHALSGWTGSVFIDSNENGVFDDADSIFSAPVTLSAGEFLEVFVKVFAPANAQVHDRNVSTVEASWQGALKNTTIIDTTTVTDTQVSISKEQAIDLGCDGVPDLASSFTQARITVPPGNNCVIYRLSAINTGLTPSFNVRLSDKTPSFTRYRPTAVCSRLPCWIVEPGFEGTGPISAETDQLLPGASFHLTFSVRIE